MKKKIYFISGLPRSGSTLLCNVLCQNPDFKATQSSAMLEALFAIRNQWDKWIEHKATDEAVSEQKKLQVLRGIFYTYHVEYKEPVIFDKSRGWLAHLELAEYILGGKAKVIVPVRDVRDILASFESLWRESSAYRQLEIESANYFRMQTVAGRCEMWSREDQPVGLAYNRVKDALQREFRDRMHFVPYERFTRNPERVMRDIYNFLGEEYYTHDFNNVEQVIWEDDRAHGMKLHDIRSKIEPQEPKWPKILGDEVARKYAGLELW